MLKPNAEIDSDPNLAPRQFWVISGSARECHKQATNCLERIHPSTVSWIDDHKGVNHFSIAQSKQLLGQDRDAICFDAWAGFCPDAFAACVGTIRAGGAMILLTPPLSDWPQFPDPETRKSLPYPKPIEAMGQGYITRLVSQIRHMAGLKLSSVQLYHSAKPAPPLAALTPRKNGLELAINPDQQASVETIKRVVIGQRRKPAVLTADRGRGKSAALGIAAGQLLSKDAVNTIVVTSSSLSGVQTLFKHAAAVLSLPYSDKCRELCFHQKTIVYVPAEQLLDRDFSCDLLIVDEAASLPGPLLATMSKRFSRIAFSTTLHGYEGSGRGFALRFIRALQTSQRGIRRIELTQPIRWGENDPLEQNSNSLLLLSCEQVKLSQTEVSSIELTSTKTELIDRSQLCENEALLQTIFSLLVEAHYRTRPVDLRHLLDSPNIKLFGQFSQDILIGVCIISIEGGLSQDEAIQIAQGKRRPHGHLLPELITSQLGLLAGAKLNTARIQRIVIRPELQRRGFGGQLLDEAISHLKNEVDLIGSSFAAEPHLIRFWTNNGFNPIRLSERKNKVSGLHSLAVLSAISDSGRKILKETEQCYQKQFGIQLNQTFKQLDRNTLLAAWPKRPLGVVLDQQDWADLEFFSHNNRSYESALYALTQFCLGELNEQKNRQSENAQVMIEVVLQHQVSEIASLRRIVSKCLKA